jgi:Tfp pilus assembly protein PilN
VRPLNLASQPFRNETLPSLLIGLGAVVLAALTVQHVVAIRRLLPAQTSAAHRELEALEQEAARLREESRQVRVTRPEPAVLAEWTQLKELVDRRAFSWTGLFSVLEQALPLGVRLLTITPTVEKGVVTLEFTAVARSYEQGLELIQVLEDRPEFADVTPKSRDDADETRFMYEMRYLPGVAGPSVPSASPSPGAPEATEGEEEEAEEEEQARTAAAPRGAS